MGTLTTPTLTPAVAGQHSAGFLALMLDTCLKHSTGCPWRYTTYVEYRGAADAWTACMSALLCRAPRRSPRQQLLHRPHPSQPLLRRLSSPRRQRRAPRLPALSAAAPPLPSARKVGFWFFLFLAAVRLPWIQDDAGLFRSYAGSMHEVLQLQLHVFLPCYCPLPLAVLIYPLRPPPTAAAGCCYCGCCCRPPPS